MRAPLSERLNHSVRLNHAPYGRRLGLGYGLVTTEESHAIDSRVAVPLDRDRRPRESTGKGHLMSLGLP
jgi:hypothetical protein